MPHLTEEQLNALKHQLSEEQQRLRADIRDELLRSDSENYGDLAGQVHDSGDESMADLLTDINTAVLSRSIKELREVEAAQERMKENSYGNCEDCDAEIPFERLKVSPSARRCVICQEKHEKLFVGEGNPTL